ncbi:uncharacterized protein G2W53_006087 [Senna tora]|uniref:Uncharacterized protein n=1 Tax=Senna tora TaxID=362788 RepID=A0A834X3Z0_9FABA|nr:uncharacterized protein G2W53_006087 [Senna tora]
MEASDYKMIMSLFGKIKPGVTP